MKLASHNSWTFLRPKKWWMYLIRFTAKCQSKDISEQFAEGVRCFDLRVKFDKRGNIIIAHGLVQYKYKWGDLMRDLEWLDACAEDGEKVYVRVLHEIRNEKEHTMKAFFNFKWFCDFVKLAFRDITFFGGFNLYNGKEDYKFDKHFSIDDRYASLARPKLIDDLYPWIYAKLMNRKNLEKESNADFVMIDFVNIK